MSETITIATHSPFIRIRCRKCGAYHNYDESLGVDYIALCMNCVPKVAEDKKELRRLKAIEDTVWQLVREHARTKSHLSTCPLCIAVKRDAARGKETM